jgi:hypothetical protein
VAESSVCSTELTTKPYGVLLSSVYVAEGESILVGFPFGFSPSNVRYPLTEKPDHERILGLDFVRVNGEKLRDPVRHDLFELLSGHRLETA